MEARLRDADPGDAEGLARLWIEFGRYYEDIDSAQFRAPEEGLATWMRTGSKKAAGTMRSARR
jgi:hypothetical protein